MGAIEAAGGPLGWWQKASRVYPHSVMLALKYLVIQASSAASERVFSVGGLVGTKKRNLLGGERVGDMFFLHEGVNHKLWRKVVVQYSEWAATHHSVNCWVPSGYRFERSEGWRQSSMHTLGDSMAPPVVS